VGPAAGQIVCFLTEIVSGCHTWATNRYQKPCCRHSFETYGLYRTDGIEQGLADPPESPRASGKGIRIGRLDGHKPIALET
jgi:hypothetical protein